MRLSSCRKTNSELSLILHYGELFSYFIIYHNVIIEIKSTINVMCVNYPETILLFLILEKLSSIKLTPNAKKVGDC